ncbi:uncharacterized protein LOC121394150 isoform X1 [Xenopus laevis]|uniref:Uncharacterized protein LOC121394150 isoform X1 n=1 Tax=Xenopus laevis TaxID=8355 RepID=A0A8J1KV65_XENLA|nr:uncharacterized protein LOC121394150 isoform X1 [Xenopus laevis]
MGNTCDRRLGAIHNQTRIQDPFFPLPSSREVHSIDHCSSQAPLTPTGCGHATSHRGNRAGSHVTKVQGVLLKSISSSQKGRFLPTCAESKAPKPYDTDTKIQDGINTVGDCKHGTGHLHDVHRSTRRLLAHTHFSFFKKVSQIRHRRSSLSIYGAAIWSLYSSTRLHEGPRTHCGLPPVSGSQHYPISRRFLDKGTHSSTSTQRHQLVSAGAHTTWLADQPQKEFAHPKSDDCFSRPAIQLRCPKGVLDTRQGPQVTTDHSISSPTGGDLGRGLLASPGTDGGGAGSHSLCQVSSQTPAAQLSQTLEQKSSISGTDYPSLPSDEEGAPLVDSSAKSPTREKPPDHFLGSSDDGCEPQGLGCSLPRTDSPRDLVNSRKQVTHQCAGIASYCSSPGGMVVNLAVPGSTSAVRQCNSRSICQQTGRHTQQGSHAGSLPHTHLGGKHGDQHLRSIHPRGTELGSGLPEQDIHGPGRVVLARRTLSAADPKVGNPGGGHVRFQNQQKTSPLLHQNERPKGVPNRRPSGAMGLQPRVCFPTLGDSTQGNQKTKTIQHNYHFNCTRLAKQSLVLRSHHTIHSPSVAIASTSRLTNTRANQTSECSNAQIDCVALETNWYLQRGFSRTAVNILLQARKPSTSKVYYKTWRTFITWCTHRDIPWDSVNSTQVIEFLADGFQKGLALRTLKTQISALTALTHRRWANYPTVQHFIKGVTRARPPLREPLATWSLPLVLTGLQRPPFEPLSTCELKWLSLKVAFLIAITSAKRVSELAALSCREPWLTLHQDKAVLRTTPGFLPKVVSERHMNQDIILPSFCPNPSNDKEAKLHTLDVVRALRIYLRRSETFRHSDSLLVSYATAHKGRPVSKRTIARWLVDTINKVYDDSGSGRPFSVKAHSTRAQSTSWALQNLATAEQICQAATWVSPNTFIKFYKLNVHASTSATFGRKVLQAAVAQ